MNWWRSLWAKPAVPVPEPMRGVPTEIVKAAVQHAYYVGCAHGEIRGRIALAREIEAQFGAETSQGLTADDAHTVLVRQIH